MTFGMRGVGDVSHMTAELLKQLTGNISLQSIPYSAMAQAVRDLMTGDLSMTVPLLTRNLAELHAAGKIRLLAVTAPKRLSIAPDIPTAIEAGIPNMIAAEFFYLFAPGGTPASILQQLNDIARAALTDHEFQKKLLAAGFDPMFAGGLDETRALFECRARAMAADCRSHRNEDQLAHSGEVIRFQETCATRLWSMSTTQAADAGLRDRRATA